MWGGGIHGCGSPMCVGPKVYSQDSDDVVLKLRAARAASVERVTAYYTKVLLYINNDLLVS